MIHLIPHTITRVFILKSLKKKTSYKNYKVYFIDDSGTGKIADVIKKKFSWVDITINKKNIGLSLSNCQ